eukprot:211639-Amphidinium_carterae.1
MYSTTKKLNICQLPCTLTVPLMARALFNSFTSVPFQVEAEPHFNSVPFQLQAEPHFNSSLKLNLTSIQWHSSFKLNLTSISASS